MAGAAARDDADLARARCARPLDDATTFAGAFVVLRVREDEAFEHLLDIELRIVEEFLHRFLLAAMATRACSGVTFTGKRRP